MADVTLHILNRSSDGLAPEGLFFEARISGFEVSEQLAPTAYDPSFHDLRYHWQITRDGDPHSPQQSTRLTNLPLAHNDTNTAYGKRIGHVFTQAGTYLVTCYVRNSDGVEARANLSVTIGDPALAFPGGRTLLVDTSGRGDPAYAGAQILPDLTSALAQAARLGAPARVLLARGQVHVTESVSLDRDHRGLWLGAFGPDTRPPPVLTQQDDRPMMRIAARYQGVTRISGIRFQGFWDSTTETGIRADCLTFLPRDTPNYTLIHDCDFDGWSKAVFCALDNDRVGLPITTYLHDCTITNWGDYGIFVPNQPGAFLSLTAVAVTQHEAALMGGPKDAQHNHHGPLRLTWPGRVYIGASDFFSRNGWSPNRDRPSEQPCIRWNTSMREGTSGVVERVAMEGGETTFAATNGGVPPDHHVTNLLVEKCLMVGSASTYQHAMTHTNGLTMRNVLAIKPNRPLVTSRWHGFLRCEHHDDFNFIDPNAPIRAYSNTIATLLDDTNRMERDLLTVWGADEFEIFSDENNVLIAPNTAHRNAEDPGRAPETIETIAGTWRPRYRGLRFQASRITQGVAQLELDESYGTPENGSVGFYLPDPRSDLAGSAMGTIAVDDFFGRIRRDPESRGAFEPES